MKTVSVKASRPYSVIIGEHLLDDIATHILKIHSPCKVAIISDSNVYPLYGSLIKTNLEEAGFTVLTYAFPAGEASKNANTYFSVLEFLAKNQITRSDLLIALGGGVVGDLTGFTAATYLRGIPYVQIPTSLLAMVDSSVGGKTAIDLDCGKNLVGAFYQPSLVVCDSRALNSLPEKVFLDGCAEVIKYGILFDEELFCHLQKHCLLFDREFVIARCVELKRDIVCLDEFDTGERQKLNLGHTIGHAVEAISNFSISHGHAVAIGIGVVARAAASIGICEITAKDKIIQILDAFGLPSNTSFSANSLFLASLTDKKRSGEFVNLIVPEAIGRCIILKKPISELETLIKAGL